MDSSLPTGREVLVVEDEVRLRGMLAQALKEMGFRATLAPTAEAAHRAIAQQAFDILILDLNLPGKGGMEFLADLRKQRFDTPAIILTGFGDLDAATQAIHLDVVEFLTKPCSLGKLEVALARASSRRKTLAIGTAAHSTADELQFQPPAAPRKTPAMSESPAPSASDAISLEELEQRHILDVLEKNQGNRAATATALGISLRKLYYRLGEYQKKGLLPPDDSEG